MVYAMMSIGLLGFQVWSFIKVAPPQGDLRENNLAICWNSFMLFGTFYSKNSNSYTQSAGNCNSFETSSSETTRQTSLQSNSFNFSDWRQYAGSDKRYLNIDSKWLEWFIGFVEGDGAIQTYKDRLNFVITQKERAILFHIQSILGFGKIRQSGLYFRYIVEDLNNIQFLCILFRNNLVLSHRQEQLNRWITFINIKLSTPRSKIYGIHPNLPFSGPSQISPSLNNAWLSGFSDAEGCFNVNITKRDKTKNGFRVQLRFILDQKNALDTLNKIRDLFGFGRVILRNKTIDNYRYYCDSFIAIRSITSYFNNESHSLKTKKQDSYTNWLKVYEMVINKEHQNEEGIYKIRQIAKNINIKNSECIKTGSAHPTRYNIKKKGDEKKKIILYEGDEDIVRSSS